ncbi:hypothetical protein [Nocardioides montaniterrae]
MPDTEPLGAQPPRAKAKGIDAVSDLSSAVVAIYACVYGFAILMIRGELHRDDGWLFTPPILLGAMIAIAEWCGWHPSRAVRDRIRFGTVALAILGIVAKVVIDR